MTPGTAAFDRSVEQRRDALVNANHIRVYRAGLKRELKAGETTVTAVLADPTDEVLSMKLVTLLLAAPKVGRVKANKILQTHRISPSKTLGGLSERQRNELLVALGPLARR